MATKRMTIMGTRHVISAGHYLAAHAGFEILEAGGNAIDAGRRGRHRDRRAADRQGELRRRRAADHLHGEEPEGALHRRPRRVAEGDHAGLLHEEARRQDSAGRRALRRAGRARRVAHRAREFRHDELRRSRRRPRIRFARDGFPMHPMMSEFIKKNEENYKRWPASRKVFLPKGRPPEVGRSVRQPDLGRTHAVHGGRGEAGRRARAGRPGSKAARDAFYKGDIARDDDEATSRRKAARCASRTSRTSA